MPDGSDLDHIALKCNDGRAFIEMDEVYDKSRLMKYSQLSRSQNLSLLQTSDISKQVFWSQKILTFR